MLGWEWAGHAIHRTRDGGHCAGDWVPVPDAYTVRIPEISPGTYRVVDEGNIDGRPAEGVVIVTVR